MRLFELIGFQDVMLYLFPALVFLILFTMFLGFVRFRRKDTEGRKHHVVERFPENIEVRTLPFPLAMALTTVGTLIWMFLYIWFTGILEVKI